jgi:cobalt-zinc-cadmium efflux system outer membrane protein
MTGRLRFLLAACWCVVAVAYSNVLEGAEPATSSAKPPAVPTLTLPEAVSFALEHNPELAAIRQQRGIAAAGVVISRTYPFNPTTENRIRAASGPASAGVTNSVDIEEFLFLEIELRNQGAIRRQQADAALTRTEWEIATQEVALAVKVLRGYEGVLYRREKLKLVEEAVRLNEKADEWVTKQREQGKLTPTDLILIRTEVADARAQRGPARAPFIAAWADLRRSLGVVEEVIDVRDKLDSPVSAKHPEVTDLVALALERRPDLHARQSALAEAEARLRLQIANRWGNPTVGPAFQYDPTRITLIGAQVNLSLPVINTHRGEILQSQAERERAALELRQTEVQVSQDVYAAVARLKDARATVKTYETQLLPSLKEHLEAIEKLLNANDPAVSVLSVIDVRRKVLKARDGYLDALWEVKQAEADLAAALGDPAWAGLPAIPDTHEEAPCAPVERAIIKFRKRD